MKPASYRMRIPPDYTEQVLNETVARLGLFKNPLATEPMYPVDENIQRVLYAGNDGKEAYFKVSSFELTITTMTT